MGYTEPDSNTLGNVALVTGLGWCAIKSKAIDMNFELRGKVRVPGINEPDAGVGLVVSIIPKSGK